MNDRLRCFCELADLAGSAGFLRTTRRHLHQHPELSFQEARTAELVAGNLKEWGWEVATGVGGHGVVGTLRNGEGARAIALRADMDALPITELTGKPWASTVSGAMHACGHDGHTTMLLGAAQHLATTRNFSGTVHVVFQPAEEAGKDSGAQRMIEDGLFERFPCDAIFGIHNHPGVAAGTFGFGTGAFMSASDTAKITVRGRGGHAARPHLSVDPILIAGSLIMALQSVVSRNIDPTQTAIVTIGSVHAGKAANVIPESATLELSIRSFDADVRERLEQRIRALVTAQVESYGGEVTIEYDRGYPVLVNTSAETEFARDVAQELVGAERVIAPFPPVTGSEDFAYFLQRKPGCFLRLGNGEGAMVHNAHYDFNDEILTLGAAYWTRLVERYLPA
ncbi:MAG: M20 family metallopeptidase [Burkholderiales bacterium]|jgi:hippurate hydrolase|nr:M20 family metallopeptidase [Burkholderiales bacterium]